MSRLQSNLSEYVVFSEFERQPTAQGFLFLGRGEAVALFSEILR
jgi:hypothetical protein